MKKSRKITRKSKRSRSQSKKSPKKSFFSRPIVLPLSAFEEITPVKTQGSSTFYKGTYQGVPFFIKNVIKNNTKSRMNRFGIYDIELAANELLASLLYPVIFQVPSLSLYLVYNDLQDPNYPMYLIGSKLEEIDDCEIPSQTCKELYQNKISGAIEPILVDAVMANWDVGQKGNIVVQKKKKKVVRLDVGGALLYRALGGPRDYSAIPNEHVQFFLPNNISSSLFQHMREDQIRPAFALLKKAKLNLLRSFSAAFNREMRDRLPIGDYKRAIRVLRSLPILQKRVEYYLKNEEAIREEMKDLLNQET